MFAAEIDPRQSASRWLGLIVIAVISEVWPHPDQCENYDLLAAELRPLLEAIEGFISAERFESCTEPGKFLSLSLWRDEAALARWRNLEEHRAVMAKGRATILRDYRIRAASVLWDCKRIAQIEVPEPTTNVTFGGKDNDLLFITASGSVYGLKMRVKGAH